MKTLEILFTVSPEAAERARDHLKEVERLYAAEGSADTSTSVVLRRLQALLDEALTFHEWEQTSEAREARLSRRPTIAEKWDDDDL